MKLSRGARQELKELEDELRKREAIWSKSPIAQSAVGLLDTAIQYAKNEYHLTTFERLRGSIENFVFTNQRDLNENEGLKIAAYVETLTSKKEL